MLGPPPPTASTAGQPPPPPPQLERVHIRCTFKRVVNGEVQIQREENYNGSAVQIDFRDWAQAAPRPPPTSALPLWATLGSMVDLGPAPRAEVGIPETLKAGGGPLPVFQEHRFLGHNLFHRRNFPELIASQGGGGSPPNTSFSHTFNKQIETGRFQSQTRVNTRTYA